jgi:hypothetical protein
VIGSGVIIDVCSFGCLKRRLTVLYACFWSSGRGNVRVNNSSFPDVLSHAGGISFQISLPHITFRFMLIMCNRISFCAVCLEFEIDRNVVSEF